MTTSRPSNHNLHDSHNSERRLRCCPFIEGASETLTPRQSIPSDNNLSTTPAPIPIESTQISPISYFFFLSASISDLTHPATCIVSKPRLVCTLPNKVFPWRRQIADESWPNLATSTPIVTGPPSGSTFRSIAFSTKCRGIILSSSASGKRPSTLTRY